LQTWAVILHPLERGVPSKTGVFDETLLIDDVAHYPWLPLLLSKLRNRSGVTQRIFNLSYQEWSDAYRRAGIKAKLKTLGPPVLHQQRHGGASTDLANGTRDPSGVKKRGRWKCDSSMNRYLRGGRIQQVLGSLSQALLARARAAEETIGGRLVRC